VVPPPPRDPYVEEQLNADLSFEGLLGKISGITEHIIDGTLTPLSKERKEARNRQ